MHTHTHAATRIAHTVLLVVFIILVLSNTHSYTPEQRDALRLGLVRWHTAFLWDWERGGRAYELTLKVGGWGNVGAWLLHRKSLMSLGRGAFGEGCWSAG